MFLTHNKIVGRQGGDILAPLMTFAPGTTLGLYSVTAKIGEGGMGEVYRARDTKLDRDVTLKVLPEALIY